MEKRFLKNDLEVRSSGGVTKIYGWALRFNCISENLGGFKEKIDFRALDGADLSDVCCLYNHDKNFILGRTPTTLKLNLVHGRGLQYEVTPPKSANHIIESVQRGDLRGSSFAFTIASNGDEWRYDSTLKCDLRTVKSISKLYDVSVVVQPAYSSSTAGIDAAEALRSFAEYRNNTYQNYDIHDYESRQRYLETLAVRCGITLEPDLNVHDARSREQYLDHLSRTL